MVTMSAVWDRTAEVLAERGRDIAAVALLALVAPAVLQAAVAFFGPARGGASFLGFVVSLAALLATVWGQLAIIGIALAERGGAPEVRRQATARLPRAIGVAILASVAVFVSISPVWGVLGASGYDFTAAMRATQVGGTAPPMPDGVGMFIAVYVLALLVALAIALARFAVAMPVLYVEGRLLGTFARSWRLTKRRGLRIFGVMLLYGIVLLVSMQATRLVIGSVLALLLRDSLPLAGFLTAICLALVQAALAAMAAVFTARLYAALASAHDGPSTSS